MSICRWSDDDWKCDVYAYDSGRGIEIHVAGFRYLGDIPPAQHLIVQKKWNELSEAIRKQGEFLKNAQREKINGPYDGKSLHCVDMIEFREKMIMLREAGYRFPDHVLEMEEDPISGAI